MKKKILLFVAGILLMIFALSGCGGSSRRPTYNIRYYVGSEIYYSQNIYEGEPFTYLSNIPEQFGYTFMGLFDEKTGGSCIVEPDGSVNVEITEEVTLYSQWQPNTFNMYLNADGGVLNDDEKVIPMLYGSKITEFPEPKREGYDFVGWVDSDGELKSAGTVPNKQGDVFGSYYYEFVYVNSNSSDETGVKLTAKWEIKKYDITFEYNDPEIENITYSLEYNQQFTEDIYPEKIDTGSKEVVGWTASYGSGIPFDGNLNSDITLFAIWKDYKKVTVYEQIDGEPKEMRVYRNEPFYIPERGGYNFTGWYSNSTMGGLPIGTVSYTNVPPVIYASWDMATYSINFVTDTGSIQTMYYTIEDMLTLPTVSKDNYTFVGWCDNEELTGTPRIIIRPGSFGNLTLYPCFKGDDRVVNFDAAGGVIGLSSQKVEYGAIVKLNVPILEGYAFVGWFDGDGNQITDRNGVSYEKWFYDGDVFLTARYDEKYYIYVTDSITGSATQFGDFYLEGDRVIVMCDSVTGYNFDGFYSSSGRLESITLEFIMIMPAEDVYLTAKYTPKQYTVLLDSDGGICKKTEMTVTYGESVVFPTVYKEGYNFIGWRFSDWSYDGEATLTDASGALTNLSGKWERDSDATLVPYFKEDTSGSIAIFDAVGFAGMSANPGGSYKLVADIDMKGISYVPFEFSGTLEGNGFTVKNLTLSTQSGNFGIFTKVTGTVSNIVFENISITTTAFDNAFVGGVCGELTGTLNRVSVNGMISGQGANSVDIGGLVGKMSGGSVINCENYATVVGSSTESTGTAGGLIGFASGGSISGCINYGTVTGAYRVGGLVGLSYTVPAGSLSNEGEVIGDTYVGGVFGYLDKAGSYTSNAPLTNVASVTGINHVGGVVGRISGISNAKSNYEVLLFNFANSADISGETYVGGILGSAYVVNNNYSTVAKVTNFINNGNIVGKSRVGGLFGSFQSEDGSFIKSSSSSASVSAESYVGGIAGEIYYTLLDSCSNLGSTVVATGYIVNGSDYDVFIGGYAGCGYSARNCENSVKITYDKQGRYVGGIFGSSASFMDGCKNTAEIYAPQASYVGGLCGRNGVAGTFTYTNLMNTGKITASNCAGGIFGEIYNYTDAKADYTVTLSRFTNSGEVIGDEHVGGIVGFYYAINVRYTTHTNATAFVNYGDVTGSYKVGGLIGTAYTEGTSSIKKSTSSSFVAADYYVGCIVGYDENLTVDSCSNEGSSLEIRGYLLDGTTYYAYAGGYVGRGNNVIGCVNGVEINYTEKGIYVGGIIGLSYGSIRDCENNADVTALSSAYVGGVCGYNGASGSVEFSGLKNTGNVSAIRNVGGIFGEMNNSTNAKSDYVVTVSILENSGTVTATEDYAAGIIGYFYINNSNWSTTLVANTIVNSGNVSGNMYVGGIFGYAYSDNSSSVVELGSSSSRIEAKAYVGGLVGKISNIKINNSSNNGTTVVATGYYLDGTTYYAYVGGYAGEGYSFFNCANDSDIEYTGRGIRIGGIAGACYGGLDKCTNNGEIKAARASEVGGIAGYCGLGGTVTYTGLENTDSVTANEYVGGIFGRVYNSTNAKSDYVLTLSETKNSGDIVGTVYTAGVVGHLYAINSNYSTRLVSTSIENTGNVTGTVHVGGIFGYAGSEGDCYIMNSSSNGIITAEYYIGGIAGQLSNIAIRDTSNEGTVIYVTGALIEDGVYYTYVGGYVGYGAELTNCHNASSITVTGKGSHVGGIAGCTYGNIKNCSNKGNITAEGCQYVGGIMGRHVGTGTKTITKVTNYAKIVGGDYTGGILGHLKNEIGDKTSPVITLSEATNNGEIIGKNYVGGIAGYFRGYNSRGDYSTKLEASVLVNSGNVSGTGTVGGLMAYCFADNSSSKIVGYTSTGVVTGAKTSQTVCELEHVTIQE